MGRPHGHQALQVEHLCDSIDQLGRLSRIDSSFARLARHVHLHQHLLLNIDARERFREMPRVDRLDESKPAGGDADLVCLQVADEMPLRALDRVHLAHGLLDAILT